MDRGGNGRGNGERRQARRYPVTLPLRFDNGTGITRNLSTSGVFFTTHRWLAPGAPIRLALALGQLEDTAARLRCEGAVVRIERCGDQWGGCPHGFVSV